MPIAYWWYESCVIHFKVKKPASQCGYSLLCKSPAVFPKKDHHTQTIRLWIFSVGNLYIESYRKVLEVNPVYTIPKRFANKTNLNYSVCGPK